MGIHGGGFVETAQGMEQGILPVGSQKVPVKGEQLHERIRRVCHRLPAAVLPAQGEGQPVEVAGEDGTGQVVKIPGLPVILLPQQQGNSAEAPHSVAAGSFQGE